MKGYIINNKCYIFPQEVGQIPSVEAEVIYVQEEDIKAWKEANGDVADKIKKYNYNVITVNPKEWSGHKDDELTPVQTYHNINKESYTYGDANAADLLQFQGQALAGETVRVELIDPATFTLDLANKEKRRIWVRKNDPDKEYHQDGDYYTFTMPDNDVLLFAGYYNGVKLTVTVDGEEKTLIEDFSNILFLNDNIQAASLTDLTDVCAGDIISLNLNEGYSFNAADTGKTHVVAKLNGTELDTREESHYREFIMPGENSTLEITTTAPQA